MNNKRWLTCDAVMVFMIVVLIAIMLSLFVVTIVGAEEPGIALGNLARFNFLKPQER